MEGTNSDDEFGIGLSGIFDDDDELAINILEQQESQNASSITSQEDKEVTVTTDASKIVSTVQTTETEKTTEEPKVTTPEKIGD